MAASPSPLDKFAFLLSGKINGRFEKDLKTVFETLTQYYGYPASHIWISHGEALTTPADFSGAHLKLISSKAELETEILTFCDAVSDRDSNYITSSGINTGVVYFTGECDAAGNYLITSGNTPVAPDWFLTDHFDQVDMFACEIIFVLQNSYSDALKGQLTGIPAPGCILYSNPDSTGGSYTGAGSIFTTEWTNGLKMVEIPGSNPKIFADMLGTSPEDKDLLISVKESYQYANQTMPSAEPQSVYEPINNLAICFFGQPLLKIRGGDEVNLSWNMSPDINILHNNPPDPNSGFEHEYFPDTATRHRNDIKVNLVHIGTHPVRSYCIAVAVYHSSETPPYSDPETKDSLIKDKFFKPGDHDDATLSGFSLTATDYNCIIARATLNCDTDFTSVNPESNENEAELIIQYKPDDLLCFATSSAASSSTAADGTITVHATGGMGSLTYSYDGGHSQVDDPQFNGVPHGTHHVHVEDSQTTPDTCDCDVDVQYTGNDPGGGGGGVSCVTLLDNEYLNICRRIDGDLQFTFKKYPVIPDGYFRARLYKIRWESPVPVTQVPVISDNYFSFTNADVVATGRDIISGESCPYFLVRVPAQFVGMMVIKNPSPGKPYYNTRIEIPVTIFFRRVFGDWHWPYLFPCWYRPWRWPWDWHLSWPWEWPWPWRWPWLCPWSCFIRIARFKLIYFHNTFGLNQF